MQDASVSAPGMSWTPNGTSHGGRGNKGMEKTAHQKKYIEKGVDINVSAGSRFETEVMDPGRR
jgi:hypothetical protein